MPFSVVIISIWTYSFQIRNQRNWQLNAFIINLIISFYIYSASTSAAATPAEPAEASNKKYTVDKSFADRRYKVQSARTYFYLNEATCERNMEIFIKCLEAVSGMPAKPTCFS